MLLFCYIGNELVYVIWSNIDMLEKIGFNDKVKINRFFMIDGIWELYVYLFLVGKYKSVFFWCWWELVWGKFFWW